MTKARTLDRRRRSIRNIRKITRTMELIATVRFKRAMDRALAAVAYTERMTALVNHLVRSGIQVSHPLLEPRTAVNQATLLVLTSNRGLCGGYNSSVLRLAYAHLAELQQTAQQVRLEISGKRGIAAFRFRKVAVHEDKPTFAEVDVLATRYLDEYTSRQIDRLDVVYTRFDSPSRQYATVETLLPIAPLGVNQELNDHRVVEYEFLPSAESIVDEVLPASFKVRLFKCFLDAAVSEQIARRVAMKAATENAEKMIAMLSMAYNRARQGQITGELLEILSGAEALSK